MGAERSRAQTKHDSHAVGAAHCEVDGDEAGITTPHFFPKTESSKLAFQNWLTHRVWYCQEGLNRFQVWSSPGKSTPAIANMDANVSAVSVRLSAFARKAAMRRGKLAA